MPTQRYASTQEWWGQGAVYWRHVNCMHVHVGPEYGEVVSLRALPGLWGRVWACLRVAHADKDMQTQVSPCNLHVTLLSLFFLLDRFKNENQTGITALEWDPRGSGSPQGNQLVFADRSGYVGTFEGVYPSKEPANQNTDPLAEDSLLMEVRTVQCPPPPPSCPSHLLLPLSSGNSS